MKSRAISNSKLLVESRMLILEARTHICMYEAYIHTHKRILFVLNRFELLTLVLVLV